MLENDLAQSLGIGLFINMKILIFVTQSSRKGATDFNVCGREIYYHVDETYFLYRYDTMSTIFFSISV